MGNFNINAFRVTYEKILDTQQFKNIALGAAKSKAKAAQRDMINAFESHSVTKELEGGADYSGPSVINYFRSDKNANLFSFIGFKRGTNPVAQLRSLLQFPIEVKLTTRVKNTYYFSVISPSREDIEEVTPMPEEYYSGTLSWAAGIEDGDLEGIEKFLAVKVSASRSGSGIQVEFINTDSSIDTTPYITTILEAFRERLQNNN